MPNGTPPPPHDLPPDIVTPDPADDEGTPQAPSKRYPWSKEKVPTKATRSERREFKRADRQAPRS